MRQAAYLILEKEKKSQLMTLLEGQCMTEWNQLVS